MANDTSAPATDDQELANMLAGLNNDAAAPAVPAAAAPTLPTTPASADTPTSAMPGGLQFETPSMSAPSMSMPSAGGKNPELDAIKKDALTELRPLVDKLDLPADEKFDTLLLIIRSTDDQTLLKPAHEAAKQITDDTKRAQALLDIIKEIDFFGNPQPNA